MPKACREGLSHYRINTRQVAGFDSTPSGWFSSDPWQQWSHNGPYHQAPRCSEGWANSSFERGRGKPGM